MIVAQFGWNNKQMRYVTYMYKKILIAYANRGGLEQSAHAPGHLVLQPYLQKRIFFQRKSTDMYSYFFRNTCVYGAH